MENNTMGKMIASLRKEKGMTQLELASLMNVTDKAVSKWERDLSCPDINSLPTLAEYLGVSVDTLMMCRSNQETGEQPSIKKTISTVLKAIPLAMGVAVAVLSVLGELQTSDAFVMLGVGLACTGLSLFDLK